jgi:hypothetical protein
MDVHWVYKMCTDNIYLIVEVIYHFGKCVTISWDCDIIWEPTLEKKKKKIGMSSISPNSKSTHNGLFVLENDFSTSHYPTSILHQDT